MIKNIIILAAILFLVDLIFGTGILSSLMSLIIAAVVIGLVLGIIVKVAKAI